MGKDLEIDISPKKIHEWPISTRRRSQSLIITEMHKTTMIDYLIPTRMATVKKKKNKNKITSVGDDMEKLEPFCIVGGNVKWYNHCEKQ